MSIDRRTWNTQNCLVNLPIVRIDPNNHRQPHQPIATREVIRVRATATYPALVIVESSRIHEYTTALNVDNLWWNLCSHNTCHSIVDTHGRVEGAFDTTKSSCTRTLLSYRFYYAINNFCHLELFNLSSLPPAPAFIPLSQFESTERIFAHFLLSLSHRDKLF